MELTIARADLQKELQLCQGIVEKRSTIPILSNVLLRAEGNRLELAATDLELTIETAVDASISEEGGVTVEARRFFDIVRSLPDDEVKLTLEDNFSLKVESGSARFVLLGLPVDDFPALPQVDESKSREIPLVDLQTMIERVVFAISQEETRFQLNGALLKIEDESMEMVATDGHRMSLVVFPRSGNASGQKNLTVLVPKKALSELMRFAGAEDPMVRFGTSDNHLFFQSGDRKLVARMVDVNFPNYREVIARDNDRRVVADRERLLATIRRVSLVANERTRAVRFDFEPGKLTVSSTNPDLGEARETVPVEYTGKSFFVGLNASYLSDFLNVLDSESVLLDLKDENSQCIGRPSDVDDLPYDYLYVVMPMRIA